MTRPLVRAALAALLTLGLAMPASADAGIAPSTERGTIQRVRMQDHPRNRFSPRTVTVSRGTRVKWVNVSGVAHTTTSTSGAWAARVGPGNAFTRRFRRSGTFPYRCTIHPEMTGTIIVS